MPPDFFDTYKPEDIVTKIENFNESKIYDWAEKAETMILKYLDQVRHSGRQYRNVPNHVIHNTCECNNYMAFHIWNAIYEVLT